MFRKLLTTAFAAAALTAAAAPAHADNTWAVGDGYVVRYQDLDLRQPADQQRLIDRFETASERLCRDVRPFRDRDTCVDMAIKTAIASLPLTDRPIIQTAMAMRQDGQLAGR